MIKVPAKRPRSRRPPSVVTPELALANAAPDARTNQLLAALPDPEWRRWLPELEYVELPLGLVLYESGKTLSHVYFPTSQWDALTTSSAISSR